MRWRLKAEGGLGRWGHCPSWLWLPGSSLGQTAREGPDWQRGAGRWPPEWKVTPGPRSHQPPQPVGTGAAPAPAPSQPVAVRPSGWPELPSSLSSQSRPAPPLWELAGSVSFASLLALACCPAPGPFQRQRSQWHRRASAASSSHWTHGGSRSVPRCSLSTGESMAPGVGVMGRERWMQSWRKGLPRRVPSPPTHQLLNVRAEQCGRLSHK